MITLPLTFRKNGFDYTQVVRQGNVAIYRQTKQGQSWEAFEVGKIRQNKERSQFGKVFPPAESWPSSEEWGRLAYTCTEIRRARQRMATLTP